MFKIQIKVISKISLIKQYFNKTKYGDPYKLADKPHLLS